MLLWDTSKMRFLNCGRTFSINEDKTDFYNTTKQEPGYGFLLFFLNDDIT